MGPGLILPGSQPISATGSGRDRPGSAIVRLAARSPKRAQIEEKPMASERTLPAATIVVGVALIAGLAFLVNRGRGPAEPIEQTDDRVLGIQEPEAQEPQVLATGPDALLAAAQTGDLAQVQTHLTGGVDIESRSIDGGTALIHSAAAGHANVVVALLDSGAQVDAADSNGTTSLMAGAAAGSTDVIIALLNAGADVSLRDVNGRTALALGTRGMGESLLILSLLEAGAEADTADDNGITPLMLAAEQGNVEKVLALLSAAAPVDATDNQGRTAREYAITREDDLGQRVLEVLGEASGG